MNIMGESTSEVALRKGLASTAGRYGTDMGLAAARRVCLTHDGRQVLTIGPPAVDLHASSVHASCGQLEIPPQPFLQGHCNGDAAR